MKLDKFLVECGVETRRKCRELVLNKYIKVNDEIIVNPSFEINEEIHIVKYNENEVKPKGKVYYMFNKPMGCITARKDSENKTVFDYFKDVNMNGVSHVGRLDKDTEGLLLFTNDGTLSNELMRPEKHISKRYYFIALGFIDEDKKNALENGVYIDEDDKITETANLEIEFNDEYKKLEKKLNLEKYYKINKEHYNQPIVSGYLTITEGRKHIVKRMLKSVGCYIIYLKRDAIGDVKLDNTLKKGEYRKLNEVEIKSLKRDL